MEPMDHMEFLPYLIMVPYLLSFIKAMKFARPPSKDFSGGSEEETVRKTNID